MHIRYDPEAGALSVSFRETTATTRELAAGIVGAFDADDQLVGLEIRDAGARLDGPAVPREVTLEGVTLGPPRRTEDAGSPRSAR